MRLLLASLVAVLLLGLAQTPASAHASLVGSDPEDGAVLATAPTRAVLTFSEDVQVPEAGVRVLDALGTELDAPVVAANDVVTVRLPPQIADGTYVVVWRVVSDDGHTVGGSLTFSVGTPSPSAVAAVIEPDDPAASLTAGVLQGVQYVALLGAVGIAVLVCLILPRGAGQDVRRRLHRWVLGASASAWIAGALLISSRTAGWLGLLCLTVGLGLLCAGLRWARRSAAICGGALALVAPILAGHSRSTDPLLVVVLSDAVHLTTGAVWIGVLGGLTLTWRHLAHDERVTTLGRFSTLAGWVMLALVASGVVLGSRILGSSEALFASPFGRVLLAKVGIVTLVVAMAACNRFVLLPRERSGRPRGPRALRRVLAAEAGVLVSALLVTGFLVQQSPLADATTAGAHTHSATDRDVRVTLDISPGAVGPNEVTVQIRDLGGKPLVTRGEPTLTASGNGLDLGARTLTPDGVGGYRTSVVLPRPGAWTMRVSLRRSQYESRIVEAPLHIR